MEASQVQPFMSGKEIQHLLISIIMANMVSLFTASRYDEDLKEAIDKATASGGGPPEVDRFTINGWQGDSYACYGIASWYDEDLKEAIDLATASGGGPPEVYGSTINGWQGDSYDCSGIENTTYHLHVKYNKTYLLLVVNAIMNEEMFFWNCQTQLYCASTRCFTHQAVQHKLHNDNSWTNHGHLVHCKSSSRDNFTCQIKSLANKDYPVNVPKHVDKSIYMTIAVNQINCTNQSCAGPNHNRIAASLTNISFHTPTLDILHAYYWTDFPEKPPHYFNFTAEDNSNSLYEFNPVVGTNVTKVKYGEAVETVFQGTGLGGAQNHPIHLHGFSFYLVGTGVPKNGWATIRFIADNPEVYFMHCHIEENASWGMGTVIVVENGPTEQTSIRQPPSYVPSCSLS
ncbi:hypothetical protein FEM48_Zijuj03G0048500 [Ziziphus jujuba var. spinosa]|uniref:Uncharacterized protein n=1 Tax=Ziziphus jujuba var. spinosa TaxID=714518 RepID=A0A978VNA0_ZIZJJ|nr:hypothetical protein FEM48_Zijuj03G0048500 [Ziziphus jujuba var. spinosa]